jgi:hypothetical protein
MSLVAIAEPQSESELSVMLSLLEVNSIPAFVQNHGLGGLIPGPQIASYNARRIMVPSEYAEQARDALAVLAVLGDEPLVPAEYSAADRLRMFLEFLFLGWFIPGHRQRKSARTQLGDDTAI